MKIRVLLVIFTLLSVVGLHAQDADPEAIPDPMPLVDEGGYDITNILLLGSDSRDPRYAGRTDVMMIVSINRTVGTVSMLSIPRDLYVYIPGYRNYRINTAYPYGEDNDYEGGGVELVKDTILYNLGIEIDYYAAIDFADFRHLIDDLGGVEVSVDCALADWRLIDPALDPNLEESWEMFSLPVGVHAMDGDLALWFARSRRTTSDFDRGRRQQVILRALWGRIRALNLLEQVTDVWSQVLELVDTDLTLETMVGLVPLAASIDTDRIASYTFRPNVEVNFYTSPEGASVLTPDRPHIRILLDHFIQPVTDHQLVAEGAHVEIVNGSGVSELARVAADRLAWEGFVPAVASTPEAYQDQTVIYDFTGSSKGSSLGILQAALRVESDNIIQQPDAERTIDFRVILGGAYNSCTYSAMPELDTSD